MPPARLRVPAPSELALVVARRVPLFRVTAPVKVLAPERVRVPVPPMVTLPDPVELLMIELIVTFPAPLTVMVWFFRSRVELERERIPPLVVLLTVTSASR